MNEAIKIVAKYAIIIPVLLALYVLIALRDNRKRAGFVLMLVAGGVVSLALSRIGSHIISDPRPFVVGHFKPLLPHSNDNGFPSDHTLLASLLGFVMLKYSRRLGIIGLVVAACIGAARVAAGVHHIEDIIGSFVITGAATALILAVLHIYHATQQSQR